VLRALFTLELEAEPLPPGPNAWVAEMRELVQDLRLVSASSWFRNVEHAALMPDGIAYATDQDDAVIYKSD
jgi:hypothetical protein